MPPSAPKEPTAKQRGMFAKMGWAMPNGSYYIRNAPLGAGDLQNAIDSVGRGENAGDSGDAIRKHIMQRAKDLGLSSKIPDTWNTDGSLKHGAMRFDDFVEHFGVRGMRWGVRKDESGSSAHSEDAVRAKELGKVVKKHGTSALSNADLEALVNRLNLESRYSKLDPKSQNAGQKFLTDTLTSIGKQQATTYGNKAAAAAIDAAIAAAAKQKA